MLTSSHSTGSPVLERQVGPLCPTWIGIRRCEWKITGPLVKLEPNVGIIGPSTGPPKKGKAIPDVENWQIWFLCQCIRGWLYINGCKLTHHFTGLQLVSSTVVGGYELCSSMWAPYWMVGKKLRWSTNNILEKYISSSLGGLLFLISSPASGL